MNISTASSSASDQGKPPLGRAVASSTAAADLALPVSSASPDGAWKTHTRTHTSTHPHTQATDRRARTGLDGYEQATDTHAKRPEQCHGYFLSTQARTRPVTHRATKTASPCHTTTVTTRCRLVTGDVHADDAARRWLHWPGPAPAGPSLPRSLLAAPRSPPRDPAAGASCPASPPSDAPTG